jgi:tape measure domain-containing protein
VDRAAGATKATPALTRLVAARPDVPLQRGSFAMGSMVTFAERFVTSLHAGLSVASFLGGAVRSLADAAFDAATAAGRITFSFGRAAVEAASFKEQNLIAFRTILGSEAAADRFLKEMVRFAAVTPFETGDVIEKAKNLLVGGFKAAEVPIVLKAVGDLGALKGFDKEVIDRVTRALIQIKAKGRLQGEELLQLAEVGVPIGKVYERLGRTFGMTAEQAQKLISAGRVKADVGVFAILDTLRESISGGTIGSVQVALSDTVEGLVSTLKSRPLEFLMNLDRSPGFIAFKGALKNLVSILDPQSKTGERIASRIESTFNRIFGTLFGGFAGRSGLEKIEIIINRVLNAIDLLIAGARIASAFVTGLFEGLGLAHLGALLEGPLDPKRLEVLVAGARAFGEELGKALLLMVDILDRASGILAFLGGAFRVAGALLPGAPALPPPTPAVSSATLVSRANNAIVNLTVNAQGASGRDAEQIAVKTGASVKDALAEAFDRASLEFAGGLGKL